MSILAFFLGAGALWCYFRITTGRERRKALTWFWMGIMALGAAGILYEIATTGRIGAPAAQWGAAVLASLSF